MTIRLVVGSLSILISFSDCSVAASKNLDGRAASGNVQLLPSLLILGRPLIRAPTATFLITEWLGMSQTHHSISRFAPVRLTINE